MSQSNLRSQVWLLHGLTGSTAGVLTLQSGHLRFKSDDGAISFDAPLGEVSAIKFPWHTFGGGVNFRVGAQNYRVSFLRPGNTAGSDLGDVVSGRESGKRWKAALLG